MAYSLAPICASYLSFLFYNSCVNSDYNPQDLDLPPSFSLPASTPSISTRIKSRKIFEPEFQWQYINFTWPTVAAYRKAISRKLYIPENVAVTGMQFHNDVIYLAFPQIRRGVPITLGCISTKSNNAINQLVMPFPNWEMNLRKGRDCTALQSVQSMEIDKEGIMWVIDGFRRNNNTKCSSKLVLLDLNDSGKMLHTYAFPNEISSRDGGFLKHIVVEHTSNEGDFAYITDNSAIDPGLIVFSRMKNRAWKLRDATMFPEINSAVFVVGNLVFSQLSPIGGLALSPSHRLSRDKFLYFCSLSGLNLYSLNTKILKNESLSKMNGWQRNIRIIGKKQSQSDGLIIDNEGNMYYGLLPLYGVAKWNINKPFSTAKMIDQNTETMVWTDSFAFDDKGYLRLLTNNINKFMDPSIKLEVSGNVQFRILKMLTRTASYINDPADHRTTNTNNEEDIFSTSSYF